jgi:hypothetical protein
MQTAPTDSRATLAVAKNRIAEVGGRLYPLTKRTDTLNGTDQKPALGYILPPWLMKLHPEGRWKRVALEVCNESKEWKKYPGDEMNYFDYKHGDVRITAIWWRTSDGKAAANINELAGDDLEKAFYVRISVLDETGNWDTSPEVPVTVYPVKRQK